MEFLQGGQAQAEEQGSLRVGAACENAYASLSPLLEGCRPYLLLVANRELNPELRTKAGASDMVQETFLSAERFSAQFHGSSQTELLAWLRQILLNHLGTARRRYQGAQKRCVHREVALDQSRRVGEAQKLEAGGGTPSRHAIRREEARAVESAVESLLPRHREIIRLRHFEQLPFDEIGNHLGISASAARQLWSRAIKSLRVTLKACRP